MRPNYEKGAEKISGIIESGSLNGVNYIKYADGTLIQYFIQHIVAVQDRNAGGLHYYSGDTEVQLAIPFTDTNYICSSNVNIANMNMFCQSYISIVNTSKVNVAYTNTTSEVRMIQVICIGRWK